MVPYNKDKDVNFQWLGSSIQATISLDQTNTTFTNLDEISGKVILRCSKAVNITTIVVKLEGESRTRLLGQPAEAPHREPKVELEYHKVLYKTAAVFPPPDISATATKGVFTLPAGTHEYPWKFKIPFNNACHTPETSIPGLHFGVSMSRGLELTKDPTSHVKKTLPPNLTGFPGEAEITYFVKATIARQGLLKENPRAYTPFNFVPIEPPRAAPTGSQIFARQRHAFNTVSGQDVKGKKKFSFHFNSDSKTDPASEAPVVSVDIRLPQPAIITCNQEIPLSIVITKLNSSKEIIYVQSLQVSLLGNTRVRAHEFQRVEQNSWIIMSKSAMNMQIGNANDADGTETTLDDRLWRSTALPNTVAPSFETCNISRWYQVDVRIGLSYLSSNSAGSKPQTVILPLRLDTLVYSGIAPPAEVLSRMAAKKPDNAQQIAMNDKLANEGRIVDVPTNNAESSTATSSSQQPPALPTRPGEEPFEAPPPSYEDAIAQDLPPVDGIRPDYAPPSSGVDPLLHADEKTGLH